MQTNRKYKDSVFTLLFSDTDRLRELYNALAGTHYDETTKITINTLSEALFFDRINDVSFTIDDKLVVLIEHQSTINPNMPLRILSYIARIYEKLIETRKIYSKTKLGIPRPEFIALYNGLEEYPDESTLRLSELFEKAENHAIVDLEVTVRVYNINKGRNPGIESKSRSLKGYAAFVAKVREQLQQGDKPENAIKSTVDWCLKQGILGDFLEQYRGVVNMMYAEWNLDDVKEVWYEDGLKEGMEKGQALGMEKGLVRGQVLGMEKGSRQSREEIARNLKKLGVSLDYIAQSTSLLPEEIARL
ncbi:hypothetical protein AGMMS50230_18010 [Spirochaetia bacterium]|nr:hypothetical protein AGMMS50230_18010 [Spirochaetia bacterium]